MKEFFQYQNKNDEFWLVEECDEYFFHELTKQDCLELSELFAESKTHKRIS